MTPLQLPSYVRWLLLAALAGIHVAAAFLMGFVIRDQSGAGDREFGLIIGVCSGQASVAAVALALGPYRFLTRLSVAGFIMALAMLPFVVMGLVEGQLEIT